MIDDDRALLHALDHTRATSIAAAAARAARAAEQDLLDVRRIGHAKENDVGLPRRVGPPQTFRA